MDTPGKTEYMSYPCLVFAHNKFGASTELSEHADAARKLLYLLSASQTAPLRGQGT
jgi:hypothetical protein